MTAPGRGRRLLVVDDAVEMQMLLEVALRDLGGFEVETAADGRQALAAAARGGWDAVVLDVQLPDMDGTDLLPHLGDLPVVLLTGALAEDRPRLLATGVRGVLGKPFDVGTLAHDVAALLP